MILTRGRRGREALCSPRSFLSLSFPLRSALLVLSPPLLTSVTRGGPAHARPRDSRREGSAERTESRGSGARRAGERLLGQVPAGRRAAAQRASLLPPSVRGDVAARAQAAPIPAAPGLRQQRVTQTDHHVRGRASATPASRERASQARRVGRRQWEQPQQRRRRGHRGPGGGPEARPRRLGDGGKGGFGETERVPVPACPRPDAVPPGRASGSLHPK